MVNMLVWIHHRHPSLWKGERMRKLDQKSSEKHANVNYMARIVCRFIKVRFSNADFQQYLWKKSKGSRCTAPSVMMKSNSQSCSQFKSRFFHWHEYQFSRPAGTRLPTRLKLVYDESAGVVGTTENHNGGTVNGNGFEHESTATRASPVGFPLTHQGFATNTMVRFSNTLYFTPTARTTAPLLTLLSNSSSAVLLYEQHRLLTDCQSVRAADRLPTSQQPRPNWRQLPHTASINAGVV